MAQTLAFLYGQVTFTNSVAGAHRRRDAEDMMEEIEESDASLEVAVVDYGEIRGMGLVG